MRARLRWLSRENILDSGKNSLLFYPIDHDLHIHTHLSACCHHKDKQTPALILELAREMGLRTVGFADHVWTTADPAPSGWYKPQDRSQIDRLRADLAAIETPLRVLVGCEADMIAPGRIGLDRATAESLDFVLLACSHFHMKGFVAQPAGTEPRALADHMLAFFRAGVESGLATSIAHPLLPIGFLEHFDRAVDAVTDSEFLDAFGRAAEKGVALEVTTGFLTAPSKPAFSPDTPLRFLILARRAGCRFTLGSDAHDPERQRQLPELAPLLAAAGINKAHFAPICRSTHP